MVAAYAYAAFALWLRGYPQQALHRSVQALQLAEVLGYPYSLAYVLACAAMLHQFRREVQHAQERATADLVCATEHGFALWGAAGMIFQGWALAVQAQGPTGEARLRQGLEAWQGTGADLLRSYHLAVLAEVYINARQPEVARSVLTEAVSAVETTAERFYEAELYRLQGQILLQQCVLDRQQAEQCVQQARRIAQRQHVTALELRASMSLGRLWQQQGKAHAARQLLDDTLQWFMEGFDTADWQDAHALLQDLQHAIS